MTKKYFCLFIIIFAQISFADDLTVFAKKHLEKAAHKYSFSLRDAKGEELINLNGGQALAPASIAKTISTFCSLKELGPFYQFETIFGYKGKVANGVLEGDLVVQGVGDPSIVIEDLREVTEKIRHVYGIKKITGKVIFDSSYFGKPSIKIANGFDGDEGRSFASELTPTPFNQNSFSVWVVPDLAQIGHTKASVLPADILEMKISNDSHMGTSTQVSVHFDSENDKLKISGSLAKDDEKTVYRAVGDYYDYYARLMRRLFVESGGEWPGFGYQVEVSPVQFQHLTKFDSRPLSKILMDINKFSLNLGAELVFLSAGAHKYSAPANYEKSMKLLNECLSDQKIQAGEVNLTNASGLSREALIKTSALSHFLSETKKSFYSPEYMSSFSLLGMDGTSKSRLKKYAMRARIKTGSIHGVRSMTGFLYSKTNEIYTFALILNGTKLEDSEVKSHEDEVIEKILETY